MNNQDIFEHLSEAEKALFYAKTRAEEPDRQAISEIHEAVKTALVKWHHITGCKNQYVERMV